MGSADEGVSLRECVGQLRCNAKVSQLDFAGFGQQNVPTLDISMDLDYRNAVAVNIVNGFGWLCFCIAT